MSLAGELLYFEKANHRNIKLILQEHRGAWEPFRGIFESIGVEAVRYEPHKCHGTYEADCRNILVENENIVNRAAPFEKGAPQRGGGTNPRRKGIAQERQKSSI